MVRKVSFLPAFFIWGAAFVLVDIIFKILNINNISFYTLDGGYDITLKITISLILQSIILTFYFKILFKEGYFISLIKAISVSSFLYIFLYILLTGIYLQF